MSNNVELTYPVIGEKCFEELKKYVSRIRSSAIVILTDENVNKLCLPVLLDACPILKSAFVIEIPASEDEKNISTTAKILSTLLENNFDRNALVINLGGGVICDLGGFIASVYKRGVRFINIPTTLLAMIDASIGGKNGINFLNKKNIIGTFTNPEGIFIHAPFIETLSKKEVRSAFAEIIKHILLSDAEMWNELKSNPQSFFDRKNIDNLINHSVKFKSAVVNEDFKESGKRKILNFGHTIGHSIEGFSYTGNSPLTHGESIAIGMIAEMYLSHKHCGFPEDEMDDAINLLKNLYNDVHLNFASEDLIPFLYADKKNAHDRIAFSLLKSPGVPAGIIYPELESIIASIEFMIDEFSRTAIQ